MTPPTDDLPPLDDLDSLDAERAADMVYNRPQYGPSAVADATVVAGGAVDPIQRCPPASEAA